METCRKEEIYCKWKPAGKRKFIVNGNLQERGNLGDISTSVGIILKWTCNRQ